MKIAVIGGGYAGLGVAWHLLKRGASLDLFEPSMGGGASGVSTGLLQPYMAKLANRSLRADEAIAEALELLEASQRALGQPVFLHTGILRLALFPGQKEAFQKRAHDSKEPINPAIFWEKQQVLHSFSGVIATEGLWIPNGKTVFSRRYLQGLWQALKEKGAKLITGRVSDLGELDGYDAVILAGGHEVLQWKECQGLPLKARHGQALVCRHSLDALPFPIIGDGHLSLMEDPSLCQLGSTYDEKFDSKNAEALRGRIGAFLPAAKDFEIVEIRSGVRIAPLQGYLPLVTQIAPKAWVFSGLGSRGLLYHALYGKELAEQVMR